MKSGPVLLIAGVNWSEVEENEFQGVFDTESQLQRSLCPGDSLRKRRLEVMAETLIMCSQGTQTSINGALSTAIHLKDMGVDVAVEFGQESLVAFAEGVFMISPLLSTYAQTMIGNSKEMGLPTDPMPTLRMAKALGVPIYTAEPWVQVLDIREKLPEEIEILSLADMMKLIAEAKRHISI